MEEIINIVILMVLYDIVHHVSVCKKERIRDLQAVEEIFIVGLFPNLYGASYNVPL